MIKSLIVGIAGIISLMILWVVIQSLWRKQFSNYIADDDVLVGRISCSNCGCTGICKKGEKETLINQDKL